MVSAPEDDRPVKRPDYVIGQDLRLLSLADIDEQIERLRAEIARLETARSAKQASRQAADSVFRI